MKKINIMKIKIIIDELPELKEIDRPFTKIKHDPSWTWALL
jgi:hypothetical protein